MLTKTKKLKVLLYGKLYSEMHRSQIIIRYLLELNHTVSLICPVFQAREKTNQFHEVKEKISICIHLIELFIKAGFVDVIYLLPANTRFIRSALWAAKLFNKKLVVEMYISLYDTCVQDRKVTTDGSRKAKAVMAKDRLALTKADYIVHTTAHELTYWEQLLSINIDRSKVFIAPLCHVSNLELKRSFQQDGVLRICWWGTFIPLHGLDNILQAMKLLQQQQLPFTCHLFGVANPFFPIYAEKIQRYNLEQQVFLRQDLRFADGSLPQYLVDNCDLALGIFGNTDKARNAVPNKLIEALSMGIPTLTMNSPALREFFNPATDLWACEPTPESIAASILTIAEGAAYPVDWERTRQKVQDTFSVARYQEVLREVLARTVDDLSEGETSDVEREIPEVHQNALSQAER